jgi:hypothetical protein
LLGLGEAVGDAGVSLGLGAAVGDAGVSLGLGAAVVATDFSLGFGAGLAAWAVPLGLGAALFVLSVLLGLGEVVLVPDFVTLGIAWGETFNSDLPEADAAETAGEGVGEEGLGEGLVLATTVGDGNTEGVARDAVGIGTGTLGLATIGLSDALGDSVF